MHMDSASCQGDTRVGKRGQAMAGFGNIRDPDKDLGGTGHGQCLMVMTAWTLMMLHPHGTTRGMQQSQRHKTTRRKDQQYNQYLGQNQSETSHETIIRCSAISHNLLFIEFYTL